MVVVGQQLLPGVEHLRHLRGVPGLLVRAQVDVELVAVDAHVQVVERAAGGPEVLVGELDRDDALGLHLLAEGDEVVERGGHLPAGGLPHRLPVEEAPGVVVVRHEVLLAVRTRGRLLQGRGELVADLVPDVAHVADEALRGDVLHAVAGEPGERVVRAALEVVGDLVLEGVVVGDARLDRVLRLLLERGGEGRVARLRHGVGGVGAEREASAPAGSGRATRRAGGEHADAGERHGTEAGGTDETAAVDLESTGRHGCHEPTPSCVTRCPAR
jgi:hypothetical protein